MARRWFPLSLVGDEWAEIVDSDVQERDLEVGTNPIRQPNMAKAAETFALLRDGRRCVQCVSLPRHGSRWRMV
jgi:hypothetical protein